MSYATAPTHNPGETIPSADWNILATDLNSGVMRPLADTTLSGSAASIDFQSIPATFAHLKLVVYLRGDGGGANDNLGIRFNNDSGANYDADIGWYSIGTPAPVEGFASTLATVARIPNAASPANVFGVAVIDIPHYANALNNKMLICLFGNKLGTTTGKAEAGNSMMAWRSNSAINRVTLVPTGNFVSGSRATLYGLPQ